MQLQGHRVVSTMLGRSWGPTQAGAHLKCKTGLAMVGVLSSKGSMMMVKPGDRAGAVMPMATPGTPFPSPHTVRIPRETRGNGQAPSLLSQCPGPASYPSLLPTAFSLTTTPSLLATRELHVGLGISMMLKIRLRHPQFYRGAC